MTVDFDFFGHENGQLSQIAPPFRFRDVRSDPALQRFQIQPSLRDWVVGSTQPRTIVLG